MEDTAALLGSAAIKTRLAGVTDLLEILRDDEGGSGDGAREAALIPLVLPLLRDHNAKITQSALEVIELLVRRAPEPTVRAFVKLLWLSLAERLGDSKISVRQKAGDVVLALSEALDVDAVLEKLKPCVVHKNWRTREQALHALWRCLETHGLVISRQSEALDDAVRLLEDSAKEVRDAAIQTLENFYSYMGPTLLQKLEAKNIRSAHMKMLSNRFQGVRVRPSDTRSNYDAKATAAEPLSLGSAPPDALSSILSSYDLQVDSTSSMARYLASVRNRTLSETKTTATAVGGGDRSPSQASSASTASAMERSSGVLGDSGVSVTEREIQKQIATIFDQLQISNDWSKRVDGLKSLQKLARQCDTKDSSTAGAVLAALSHGVRTVRERLGEHVGDLRSSVSREACQTIQLLASVLGDDFNAHAEFFMGSLLKATYVTIQVISTAADTSIRGLIHSTSNGYARIIQKFMDGARSRNQVLKVNCVAYLTLTLEQWSPSFLSKNTDLFVANLPSLLQDAVGDVRAQSRKCYWAFHHLFRSEANGIYNRLDASTQKNLRDDPARTTSESARKLRQSANDGSKATEAISSTTSQRFALGRNVKGVRLVLPGQAGTSADSQPMSTSSAQRILQSSGSDGQKGKLPASANGPRRVLGSTSSFSFDDPMDPRPSMRVLSQAPKRIIERENRVKSSDNDDVSSGKRNGLPLRVLSTPKASSSSSENTVAAGSDGLKPQRVQVPDARPDQPEIDRGRQGERAKRPPGVPATTVSASVRSDRPSPRNQRSNSESDAVGALNANSGLTVATTTRQSGKQHDRVEDALRNLEHSSWSVRMDAIETIGKALRLQERAAELDGDNSTNDTKVDDRIISAFVKHMNDAHYRVSQTTLLYLMPLLKLSIRHTQQLQPHFRTILSTLFQRVIETKESVRVAAKENLTFIAESIDASTLVGLVISFLGDGSNVKVKAAVCKYLQTILPSAGAYMRQNNNHMRSFLLKLAQLLDGEVPVSLASACGDLVSVAVHEFATEMESVMPVLPPTKRSIIGKLLKARGINLSLVSGITRPPVAPSNVNTARSRDMAASDDNQKMEKLQVFDERASERSRKRAESPTANSSPALHLQKRLNRTGTDTTQNAWRDERAPGFKDAGTSLSIADARSDPGLVVESALRTLRQNNSSDRERKKALYQIVSESAKASDDFWNENFEPLLMTLLEIACDDDVYALKVLLRVVSAAGSRAELFFDVLVERLLAACGGHSDVSLHLAEAILCSVVTTSGDQERVLRVLTPFLSTVESPALLAVLRLVRSSISLCGQKPSQMSAFLRHSDRVDQLLRPLTSKLAHGSSDVRKNTVDCLVGFFVATEHDKGAVLAKYLDSEVDDTRKKLVEIYIDRAKRDRVHHRAGV